MRRRDRRPLRLRACAPTASSSRRRQARRRMRCRPAGRSSRRSSRRSCSCRWRRTRSRIGRSRSPTIATSRITVMRGRDAGDALRRPGAFRAGRRRPRHARRAQHSGRASCIREGHDYFAMLREKLHWSATPERSTAEPPGQRLDASTRFPSAISSWSRRSTSTFAEGFTVLTGETGAGKSILLDALGLLLGDRFEVRQLRAGAERAELAAGFDVTDCARRRAPGSPSTGSAATATRCCCAACSTRRARSRAWINGSPATLAQLKSLGEMLVAIHGQHAHQSLEQPEIQRARRRRVRRVHDARRSEVGATWRAWRAAVERLDAAAQRRGSDRVRARVSRAAPARARDARRHRGRVARAFTRRNRASRTPPS